MDDFRLDALTPEDLDAALRLSTQAGWNQNEADWRRLLELFPNGCLAGRSGGRLIATATVASYAPGLRWIGMVLVDAAERGKGLGTRILAAALERALAEGPNAVGLDATDLGRPLYRARGFADVEPIDRWEGPLSAADSETTPEPLGAASLEDVIAFDRASCGADRGALLRRLVAEPGVAAWIVRSRSGVEGYAVLRPGRRVPHVGPVVAATPGAARALLGAAGRALAGRPAIVDAPRRPEITALLERYGMDIRRRLVRMTYPEARPLLAGPRVVAAAGFEWG
ncbi:MAG TPA: GNAT family N-acetyltransferase [Planctomycetota bacterium]|nr:GNAT family N-acetyltransferase [Planctomycetota bacterium]